jgi:hypothetical protein
MPVKKPQSSSSPADTVLIDAVRDYCQRGWELIPIYGVSDGTCDCGKPDCTSPGKHPLLPKWTEKASSDFGQVQRWYDKFKSLNIAVKTGAGSRLIVLDIDGPEGEESLSRLQAKYGALPPTLSATTGRGRHLYFMHPGGRVKSNAGVLGAKLDVRGDGGYVILPPSKHVSGVRYEWV